MSLPIPASEEAEVIAAPPARKTISSRAATQAAKRAGFTVIRGDKLAAAGLLGQFIGQVGAIHLGRSILAVSAEHCSIGLEECEQILAKGGLEPETEVALMKIKKDLLESYINTGNSLIKSAQVGAETDQIEQQMAPGFTPRSQVVPPQATQVNIVVNGQQPQDAVTAEQI